MRTTALIKRICQQMFRDKRTLALLFVAPLLILTLMYFLFNGNTVNPKLGVVNIDQNIVKVLKDSKITVKDYEKATSKTVVDDNLDGMLQMENGNFTLTLKNADPTTAKALQLRVNQAVASVSQAKLIQQLKVPVNIPNKTIETKYIYGNKNTVYFDVLSPILVGFFVFFFVFIISGIGLLRERTTGTLERLLSTPIRRAEIVFAYLIGYGIFAVIQTIIVVLYAINVLDLVLVGSLWTVIVINLLLALVALSLGILLSSFAASEFQMIQFIPIAVIPQVFFAGIFPLEGMANWLQGVAKIIPMYYAGDALKGVMYKGYGFSDISGDLLALVIFAAIFIVLNIFALKRYRKL
ncbi:ABC transporter permease [Neobacillus massiliamazoniensis]|jgi:ABC-2 type transport system permease protein|uniref:ABC-2 type transporter n=1 Tax=Neobacillus massiliamazoniensis TaxID=1499688 RepID=A0A0U1NSK0_9BACI|nr:ABC transporter permease [Neobacillus massiliamazoniensis]CRK81040.1 ABC-2 type transporter [Neobacillus massiliamazoniensis]